MNTETDNLPPMPTPDLTSIVGRDGLFVPLLSYSADRMREYALAAIAARQPTAQEPKP